MTKGSIEERVRRLSAVLDKVLAKVSAEPPIVPGRTSAVEVALAAKRREIERALEMGYRPGTIARLIHDADDVDTPAFSKETIRLAIVRIARREQTPGKAATTLPRSRRRRDTDTIQEKSAPPTRQFRPPTTNFAGFDEDPR